MKEKEQSSLQTIKRFFEPLGFDKKVTIKAFTPAILNGIIWSIVLILIKDITNIISGTKDWNLLGYTIAFIALSLLYSLVIIVARNWTHVKVWPFWRQCFYDKYMKRYLQLDNNEIEKIWTGRLIAIMDKWFHTHIDQMVSITKDIGPTFIQIIISIIFIFFLNQIYWLVVLFALILLWILIYIQQNKAQYLRKIRNELNIWVMRNFVKILMSKFEVLSTNKWGYEINKLTTSLDKNWDLNIRQMNITVWVDLWLRIFIDGIALFMIILFGFGFFTQTINIWEFASLIGIVYFMDKALAQLKSYYVNFLKSYVEIDKLWTTFDNMPKMPDISLGKDMVFKKWDIWIKDVSFSYGKKPVFENFNLEIKGWTKTAFVGESWWGKTTLIKLLTGYIRPDKGDIEIDGQKLWETKLSDYYQHIGYLTQDPSVFDGSVYENLIYALEEEPPREELEKIIKLAKCDFIWDFEKKLETEIGERWIRLSGWQKQRLAIAKIMLKNPSIILLDEPTSALDSFNEEQINIALNNLFKGKTVIVVAHRLQTVKSSDTILLFEDGKISERGNHKELIKLNGQYKKMLDLQSWF